MGVTAEAQQYSFQSYGVDQGLTDLAVRSLFQDARGFLWLSTENGIFRYDGTRFQAYTQAEGMPASNAAMFGEAPDGTLLVGGSFGLYRQVSDRFEPLKMPGAKEVMWGAGIQSDSKGQTWIATNAGLMLMTRDQLRLTTAPPHSGTAGAYGVLAETNNNESKVWWGCGDDLCAASSGATAVLGRESGLPASPWRGIKRAGNGDLWVQSKSGQLLVMRHGKARFEASDLPPSPFGPRGLLGLDTSGNVIAPYGEGLAIQEDGRWKIIGRASGLHGPVYSVLQDREGSVWIGLGGHGLVRWLGYRQWEHYNAEDGLDGELVYQVNAPADGTLWAGTDSGLFRGRKAGPKWKWRRDGTLGDIPIHSVRPDAEGRLWLGTESHGAARMDALTGKVEWFDKRRGLTAESPYTMFPDHANRIWAGTLTGLFVADGSALRFHAVPEVPAVQCLAVLEAPDGTIWAGTKQGLFQLSGGHWRGFTTGDGLSHNEVLSLAAEENGDIWVGYQFGGEIDRIQPHNGFKVSHERSDPLSAQGLTYFLGFDAGKRLWVGTNHGVDVRNHASWQHYDQHDGLVWDDCDLNGFLAMPDGAVWIGTSGGLAHFLPGIETRRQDPPRAIFTKLTLGGNDAADNASVGHRANALAARFSALSFIHENKLLFRYRLAPLFSDWRETRQRDLQFPGLAPDSYRLEVEARDGSGRWSAQPALFAFEVQPPWWRKWWATSLLVAAALGLLALVIRWRGEAARTRENDLVRLVDERTTELKQANGSLLETTLKLQDVNKYLFRLSTIDGLTGIANRRMFDKTLEEEWNQAKIDGTPLSVILADIDYFKRLNDAAGHQAGDECLKRIAADLAKAVKRDEDLVARFGGEEFVLILPMADHHEATLFAETIRASIERLNIKHPDSPVSPGVTISLGIATQSGDRFPSRDALVGAADAALYAAKQRGRNRAVAFEPTPAPAYAGSDSPAHLIKA